MGGLWGDKGVGRGSGLWVGKWGWDKLRSCPIHCPQLSPPARGCGSRLNSFPARCGHPGGPNPFWTGEGGGWPCPWPRTGPPGGSLGPHGGNPAHRVPNLGSARLSRSRRCAAGLGAGLGFNPVLTPAGFSARSWKGKQSLPTPGCSQRPARARREQNPNHNPRSGEKLFPGLRGEASGEVCEEGKSRWREFVK